MITYEKVYSIYPNYKVIGIESIWYPGQGWLPWMEIYCRRKGSENRDSFLLSEFSRGAEKVQLILAHEKTGKLVWSDFAASELLTN